MRILCGLLLLLGLSPGAGQAQSGPVPVPLTGQVVNRAQRPLAGVSVQVMGTSLGASTNSEGAFLLESPAQASYTLRFDLPGHLLTDVVVSDTTRWPLRVTLFSTQPAAQSRKRKR